MFKKQILSLEQSKKNHVQPTTTAVSRLPSSQMAVRSFPKSFPGLSTSGAVQTWSWWGTEPLWISEDMKGHLFLTPFLSTSKEGMRLLHGVV